MGASLSALFGLSPNSSAYTEIMVLAGLVYFHTPVAALILIGTIQGNQSAPSRSRPITRCAALEIASVGHGAAQHPRPNRGVPAVAHGLYQRLCDPPDPWQGARSSLSQI